MQNDEAFVQLNIIFFVNLYEMYVYQSNPIFGLQR